MNEEKEQRLSKKVGLFVIVLSTDDGVSLDFIDEKTRVYLNNLYPEWLNMLGMKFSLDVEKEINIKGKMPINDLTLNNLASILHKNMSKMPFTLRQMLLSHKI
jgi:hypothetical protein